MIELSEKILINADVQKVWAFLTDVEKSLSFNRFHVDVILPNRFSVNNKSEFIIIHNFGFGNIEMTANVIECVSVKRITISEEVTDEASKGFPHKIIFEIYEEEKSTILNYSVNGTYGGRVQDISFMPILKGVVKEEIIKIKNAIESSEEVPENLKVGRISP
ncbi:MAG: SRPBCC family protein [Candidatus Marinimicrobia bacterium]|nr:SRPBCC family protein [Candidatus Neomarinimicrobiota bacterium]